MRLFLAFLLLVIGGAAWWLLLDSRPPASAEGEFDIVAYRALVENDRRLPEKIAVETVGEDFGPAYGVETMGGLGEFEIAFTAFQIVSDAGDIVIGGAVDAAGAEATRRSEDGAFDPLAYARLLEAMSDAEQVFITHAHYDHTGAILANPQPRALAGKLRLTAPQIAEMTRTAEGGELPRGFGRLRAAEFDGPTRVAPGVVVVPTPGHTEGSLSFYVKRADGVELLLIGDIAWAYSNITRLRTRPRLIQYLIPDWSEDRAAILRQIRALHELRLAEPGLVIIPSHDAAYLRGLEKQGLLSATFKPAYSRPRR